MKKTTNNEPYFGDREEQAVNDYINSDSKEEKNRIYNEILIEPFRIMAETILRRWPVQIGDRTMSDVEDGAVSHLIEVMITYNPNRIGKNGGKAKAYSYCQTIIRNHYRLLSKKACASMKANLSFDDFADEINDNIQHSYEIDIENDNFILKLINNVINKIESVLAKDDETLKPNEIAVGYAIINILRNWDKLFIEETPDGRYQKKITNKFTKNKILFYIKEQTNLTTKDIRLSMKAFKDLYFIEKMELCNKN